MPHQISHDNALDSLPYELVMGVLANKTQMNGCNVSVTWFAMFYHSGEARACQQFLWSRRRKHFFCTTLLLFL